MTSNIKVIYLAGGCFWGVQAYFKKVAGVLRTNTGYSNGDYSYTDYQLVKKTNHTETVQVFYNPNVVSLNELLLHYYRIIDPCSVNKQGPDKGTQYRTGIYYENETDLPIIEKVTNFIASQYDQPLAVEIKECVNFVKAEDYHQDYLDNNPTGYCHINMGIFDKPLFNQSFDKPDIEQLQDKLTPLEFRVTQQSGTEPAFTSELEDVYEKGIYISVVSGEPLFSSEDKFDSGCGWPSFTKAILTETIKYLPDNSLGMQRTEVRVKNDDAHLGHVFNDGPYERGGMRYCINGAALRFVKFEDMDELGYGDYKVLFNN